MWDRLRVGTVPTLKNGASPPERKGFLFFTGSGNNSSDSFHETSGGNGTYSYSIQGGAAARRPSTSPLIFQDTDTFAAPQAPPRSQRRDVYTPTYSQGYPDSRYPGKNSAGTSRPRYVPHDTGGISPPSSPEIAPQGDGRYTDDPADISPIDEYMPDMPPQPLSSNPPPRTQSGPRPPLQPQSQSRDAQPARTNIPMMRRERRKNQDAVATSLRAARSREQLQGSPNPQDQGDIRWDTVTGEPTTSDAGRPAQVKPAEYAQGLGIGPANSPSPPSGPAQRGLTTVFGERVRRLAKPVTDKGGRFGFGGLTGGGGEGQRAPKNTDPAATAFSSERPQWRGASGRTALVAPVKDTTNVAPLVEIPRKSSKRVAPSGGAPGSGGAATPVTSTSGAETANGSGPPHAAVRQVMPSSQLQSAPINADEKDNDSAQPGQLPSPPPEEGLSRGGDEKRREQGVNDSLPSPQPTTPQGLNAAGGDPASIARSEKSAGIRRKPPPAHQNPQFGHAQQNSVGSVSVYSQDSSSAPRPPPHAANPTSVGPSSDGWVQPSSRFSVTTYATSSRSSHNTPRESLDEAEQDVERPPLPDPPSELLANREPQANMMDRRRARMGMAELEDGVFETATPMVISVKENTSRNNYNTGGGGGGVGYNMSSPYGAPRTGGPGGGAASGRKAVGSMLSNPSPSALARARPTNAAANASAFVLPPGSSSPLSPRPESIISINKDLPPAPPETSATSARDRVALLNAQLSALGNRRINLTRSIKQMTELMPTDTIMATAEVLYKREAEKRKIEVLRDELADVQRQEYELGLKLHRAYKRLDRDAEWEGTALWVRRVTG